MKFTRSALACVVLSASIVGIATVSAAAPRVSVTLEPIVGSVVEVPNVGVGKVVSTMPITISDNYWAPLNTRNAYAKFALGTQSGSQSDVVRAVLRVSIQNCDAPYSPGGPYSAPVRVAATTGTAWTLPTWSTRPEVDDERSRRPIAGGVLEFNVTDAVAEAEAVVGFQLRMTPGSGRPRFQPNYCNINGLSLVVTTNAPRATTTPPSTATPTTVVPSTSTTTSSTTTSSTTISSTTTSSTTTSSTTSSTVPGVAHAPIGLAAPAYIYKGIQADYDKLIASGLKIVVLNPNSGPSNAIEPEYASHIQRFTAAGTKVFGYVRTNYGTQPIATVQAEVQRWMDLYGPSGLAGIFFDESTSDCSGTNNYYEGIIASAHSKGLQTILNPGVVPSAGCLTSSTDIMVTWENNDALAQTTFLDSTTVKWKQWHIVYNVASCSRMSALATQARANKVDYFWATDDPGPAAGNPFDTVPSFLTPMNLLYTTGTGAC